MVSTTGDLRARRAVEALRAGVPNRDAVEALGFDGPDVLARFDEGTAGLTSSVSESTQPRGMLLAGEFGAGKSHALEFLAHRALDRNIAVSKVVVSKETQLFDPAKLFRAAIDGLRVRGIAGSDLSDITLTRLDARGGRFVELVKWLRDSRINSRFAATIWLYENGGVNPELRERLVTFWSGGPIAIGQLRRDLREAGQARAFDLERVLARDLARQRFQFMARLLHGAGYDGWLIMLDELELIGRYTVLQRGRAYAELARMMGLAFDEEIPGLFVVGAITPDFSSAVIRGKDDLNQISFKFRQRDDDLTAGLAERAMEEIERNLVRLPEPDDERLETTLRRLVDVYTDAYGRAEVSDTEARRRAGWQMREYVRGWITSWDLRRLDPAYQPDVEVDRIVTEYTEDAVWEAPAEGTDEGEPDPNA